MQFCSNPDMRAIVKPLVLNIQKTYSEGLIVEAKEALKKFSRKTIILTATQN